MRYDVLLMLAGQGQRMENSGNKVFIELSGQALYRYSLATFLADQDCGRVILVGRDEERNLYREDLSERVVFVNGGAERQDSVRLGLAAVREAAVMVHDGARPFVSSQHLQDLKQQINSILAVPVKDTIKRVEDTSVLETIPRQVLYQAQTPQFFETDLLKRVHQAALEVGYLGTDDASLVEQFSDQRVSIIPGAYSNIKLTTPEDIWMAESILKNLGK